MYRFWLSMRISAIAIISLSLILIVQPSRVVADQEDKTTVEFLWACGAMVGSGHDQRLISIRKDTVLHTGDRIKFYIDPQSECFVYLFYHSAQGELLLLLPSEISAAHVFPGAKYYIPTGNAWFILDEVTGTEKFFLLASAKKLEKLESLYRNHIGLTNNIEIEISTQSILSEIKSLKRQHRNLTAAAERPVRLGGNFRGIQDDEKPLFPDVSQIAIEISALNFYSRTFTIDHQ